MVQGKVPAFTHVKGDGLGRGERGREEGGGERKREDEEDSNREKEPAVGVAGVEPSPLEVGHLHWEEEEVENGKQERRLKSGGRVGRQVRQGKDPHHRNKQQEYMEVSVCSLR